MAETPRYDGSAGYLVDTNVWIDVIRPNSPWRDWAFEQLQACSELAPLHVNLVIYAELIVPGMSIDAIDAVLDVYGTTRSDLPWRSAPLVAAAYAAYRGRGGVRTKPLPDFFIGAHAAASNFTVLTRDGAGYQSYFPGLTLMTP